MSELGKIESWVHEHPTGTAVGVFLVGAVAILILASGHKAASTDAQAGGTGLNLNSIYSQQLQASTAMAGVNAQNAQTAAGVQTAYANFANQQALATISADTTIATTNSNNQVANNQTSASVELGESANKLAAYQTQSNNNLASRLAEVNELGATSQSAILAQEQVSMSNNQALATIYSAGANAKTAQVQSAYQAQATIAQAQAGAAIAASQAGASASNGLMGAIGSIFGGLF